MICYHDRTFCVSKTCKKFCDRHLTKEIELEAMKFGLPLSLTVYDCDIKDEEIVNDI